MAELNYFHFCDTANTTENGKLNLTGIFTEVNIKTLPAVHPQMSLVAGIELDEGTHKISIKDEEGALVFDDSSVTATTEQKKFSVITNISLYQIKEKGLHKFEILVDGEKIGEASFEAK